LEDRGDLLRDGDRGLHEPAVGVDVPRLKRHREVLPRAIEDLPAGRAERHRPFALVEREALVLIGLAHLQDAETNDDDSHREHEHDEKRREAGDRRPAHAWLPVACAGGWSTCTLWGSGGTIPCLRAHVETRSGAENTATSL